MKLFLDANVIYSASRSTNGASYTLCQLGEKFNLSLITSTLALVEAERNLAEKEKSTVIERFYQLLKTIKIVTIESSRAKQYYKGLIEEKDAPILYGALRSQADYLITLDKKHFFTEKLRKKKFPFIILTPGQFIKVLTT